MNLFMGDVGEDTSTSIQWRSVRNELCLTGEVVLFLKTCMDGLGACGESKAYGR